MRMLLLVFGLNARIDDGLRIGPDRCCCFGFLDRGWCRWVHKWGLVMNREGILGCAFVYRGSRFNLLLVYVLVSFTVCLENIL